MTDQTVTEQNVVTDMMSRGTYLLRHAPWHEEERLKVVRAFLDGIEELEGPGCRGAVAQAGLHRMHDFFPASKVRPLMSYVGDAIPKELYAWTVRAAKEHLGLSDEFFVDHLIVVRVHYPFAVASKVKSVSGKGADRPSKRGLARRMPMAIARRGRRALARLLGLAAAPTGPAFNPARYHRNLPKEAWSHGPHLDTWYGHSFDGINVWWAIDGVNEDDTVILYPEMFGRPVRFEQENMYLSPGIPLPKPTKVVVKPGEALFFNPEMLHGTQVNISDETRVVISTRINPGKPTFEPYTTHGYYEQWYSSRDIERGSFKLLRFQGRSNTGSESPKELTSRLDQRRSVTHVPAALTNDGPVDVCDSASLAVGETLLAVFENAQVLIVRRAEELKAFDARCAHVGINLIDGFHDEDYLYCPGHGIAYSLDDGTSKCPDFWLREYQCFEEGGRIYCRR